VTKIYSLCSGSQGNSTYIECRDTAILIDAGCSAKKIKTLLKENALDIDKIKSIFITHEHIDHIRGLRILALNYGMKVYLSAGTMTALIEKEVLNSKILCEVIPSSGIEIGDLLIKPFHTSHDSIESLGYIVVTPNQRKIAFATDMGYISSEVEDSINGSDVLFIESNHDVGMLKNGPYPYFLKRRILSNKGHLSNEACAKALPKFVKSGATRIVLSHLSEKNNIPLLAYKTATAGLSSNGMKQNFDFKITVAAKENHGGNYLLI
jgi:phosphoribosyl 1,2-cyclic phosphodiesterase